MSTEVITDDTLHPEAGSDSWCTPKWLADALGFFTVDPCSNPRSHIRSLLAYYIDEDGLAGDWWGSVFCNPPYSNVGPWGRKLVDHNGPWVALLKLDPTTRWWETLMSGSPIVAPFRKRIKFETDSPKKAMTANFPSVLVYRGWTPPAALVPHLWL